MNDIRPQSRPVLRSSPSCVRRYGVPLLTLVVMIWVIFGNSLDGFNGKTHRFAMLSAHIVAFLCIVRLIASLVSDAIGERSRS